MVPTTMGGRPCGLPPIVFLGLLQALYNFVFWWYLLGMTLCLIRPTQINTVNKME